MVYLHPGQPRCGPYSGTTHALMMEMYDHPTLLNMTFSVLATLSSCLVWGHPHCGCPWSLSSVSCALSMAPRCLVDGRHGVACMSSSALASNLYCSGNAVLALALTTPNGPNRTSDAGMDPTQAPHLDQASDVLCVITSSSSCVPRWMNVRLGATKDLPQILWIG